MYCPLLKWMDPLPPEFFLTHFLLTEQAISVRPGYASIVSTKPYYVVCNSPTIHAYPLQLTACSTNQPHRVQIFVFNHHIRSCATLFIKDYVDCCSNFLRYKSSYFLCACVLTVTSACLLCVRFSRSRPLLTRV